MNDKLIRIRAFLDDTLYGQLLNLNEVDREVPVHFIRENSDIKSWLTDNAESSDELLAVPLTDVPVTLDPHWEKSALLPRQDPGFSIYLIHRKPELPIIRQLQGPLRVFFHEKMAQQQCETTFPHWSVANTREDADAEVFQTRFWTSEDPDHPIFHLDPAEIIPLPGAGTICLLSAISRPDMKSWARQLHDRSTANCTNVERSIAVLAREKGLPGEVYAYVRQSERGFDISAAYVADGEINKVVRSVTSSAGAASTIVNEWLG